MTIFVALLRGINVGGGKKIPMAQLRELFGDLGYPRARSYIQSGNVVFASDGEPAVLADEIRTAIATRFGFEVPVLLRSREQLDALIAGNPFAGRDIDPAKLAVVFLSSPPPDGTEIVVPPALTEEAVLVGGELFIYHPDGMGRSKINRSAAFWRPLKQLVATTRNIRTVGKLREMMD